MKRKNTYFFGIIPIIICSIFYIYKSSVLNHIKEKCPDEYGTDDASSAEYLADFDKWTNNFYDNHPDATLSEWSKARYQFWLDNDCAQAIKRYNEVRDGNADPVIMNEIENSIQEAIR